MTQPQENLIPQDGRGVRTAVHKIQPCRVPALSEPLPCDVSRLRRHVVERNHLHPQFAKQTLHHGRPRHAQAAFHHHLGFEPSSG